VATLSGDAKDMRKEQITRRAFVKQGAAGASAVVAAAGRRTALGGESQPAGRFSKDIGFQLYTLRNVLDRGPEKIFQQLAETGYREIEVLQKGLDKLVPLMKSAGLNPVSGHFDTPLVTGNWDVYKKLPGFEMPPEGYDWKAAAGQARQLGLKYMVVPYLQPAERGGLDFYRGLADKLNKAGEVCQAQGLKLCYHHHAFEFNPVSGQVPLDVLMERSDRNLVGLEVDVFWVSVAGSDPVEIFRRFSGRVPLVHLKDEAKGTARVFDERKVPPGAFKEVGNGILDFPAMLRAAAKAGVEHYFVEQDQCQGDPVASLQLSYRNLRKINL